MSYEKVMSTLRREPLRGSLYLLDRISPKISREIVSINTKRMRMDKSVLIISLDCDTDEDAEQVTEAVNKLLSFGIRPSIAAPAELVLRHLSIFKKLADKEIEFINHGFYPHTILNSIHQGDIKYKNIDIYKSMSKEEIEADITLAHRTLEKCLKQKIEGFRTPHFSNMQSVQDLRLIYALLENLQYSYSSSSGPHYFLKKRHGRQSAKIKEIPLIGGYDKPFRVFDSWSYIEAGLDGCDMSDYLDNWRYLLELSKKFKMLLNTYMDPRHLVKVEALEDVFTQSSLGHLKIYNLREFAKVLS